MRKLPRVATYAAVTLGGLAVSTAAGAALGVVGRAAQLTEAVNQFDRRFTDFHDAGVAALSGSPAASGGRDHLGDGARAALDRVGETVAQPAASDIAASPLAVFDVLGARIGPPPDGVGALILAYDAYVRAADGQHAAEASRDPRALDRASQAVRQRVDALREAAGRDNARACSVLAGLAALLGLCCAATLLLRRPSEPARPAPAEPDPPESAPVIAVGANNIIVGTAGNVPAVLRRSGGGLVRTPVTALFHPSDSGAVEEFLAACRERPQDVQPIDVHPVDTPQAWCRLELTSSRRRTDDRRSVLRIRLTDVSELRHTEEALKASGEMLRTLTEAAPQAIVVEDRHGRVKLWNAAAARMFGWSAEEVVRGQNPSVADGVRKDHENLRAQVLEGLAFPALETTRVCKDGSVAQVSVSVAPLRDSGGRVWGLMEVVSDITDRKVLEAQLLQAQKMEGIGRLAGGIAHDFNNLLTAIVGQADMLLRAAAPAASPGDRDTAALRNGIEQIKLAADRASHMTGQLLAFSRNQVMQPTIMDLNKTITEMHQMLQRLIGEDIDLATIPAEGLHHVKADPTHITQVLINLAVNARDAMGSGGKLTIETANVELDDVYSRRRMAVVPGSYVMLAVSDTGHGMHKDVQARAFEPFFTTKERGKGTGLGLATVYGIVKQSGGYIWCYSEVGHGTCFKVYLPAVKADRPEVMRDHPAPATTDATETVLLVEDEEMVRTLVRQVLTWYGYKVLEAYSGEAAIRLAETHDGRIDLLMTDLVMPGMTGIEVAKHLAALRPTMRILYMSGYTDHAVVRHHLLHPRVPFIQKPFAPDRLAHKVREVLNGPVPKPEELAGPGQAMGVAAHSALSNQVQ